MTPRSVPEISEAIALFESWEESIKNRQLAQHEHKRIYQ